MTSSERPVILIGPANYEQLCPSGRAKFLEAGARLIENPHDRPYTREELFELVPQISGAVVGVEAWDAEVIQRAPGLQVLSKLGVGIDNIDLDAATAQGVLVTNVPGGNTNAVAELALGLVLALFRHIPAMGAAARSGDWTRYVGAEIAGKTVGLIGFGSIGRRFAQLLSGFGVNVSAWDPYPDLQQAESLGVQLTEFDTVLAESDIVSLHVPSLPETHHLMSTRNLAMMKLGSVLVNTARGALVDERALVAALESGHLAGAALDVFEVEPVPVDSPLLALPNVIATSHGAADSFEAYEHIGIVTAEAILGRLAGVTPKNVLNDA